MNKPLSFIDLFAGIGGFHTALHSLGCSCVFASEIDNFARDTYELNYRALSPLLFESGNFAKDITQVVPVDIPDFDILCAGFPCQPFSQAGLQKGFQDTRGTLFYNILQILENKRPSAFILENVRNLHTHDNGNTFAVIKNCIESLGYSFHAKVLKGTEFGVPQPRPRLYMVGFKNAGTPFSFPQATPLSLTMSDILGGKCSREIGFTLRVGGRHSPISDRHNWDGYIVDGKEVRLSNEQGLAMQGFPTSFKFNVSNRQAMKQLGNSVAVPVVTAVASNVINALYGEISFD